MFEVEFSGYASNPDAIRTARPNDFGLPSVKIDGERPSKMTLTGVWNGGKIDEAERNRLTVWFLHKCLSSMIPLKPEIIIDTELPEELWQWYIAAERYKGVTV